VVIHLDSSLEFHPHSHRLCQPTLKWDLASILTPGLACPSATPFHSRLSVTFQYLQEENFNQARWKLNTLLQYFKTTPLQYFAVLLPQDISKTVLPRGFFAEETSFASSLCLVRLLVQSYEPSSISLRLNRSPQSDALTFDPLVRFKMLVVFERWLYILR